MINPISPSPQPLLGRFSCCLVIPAWILWSEGRKVFILKEFLTLLSTLPTAWMWQHFPQAPCPAGTAQRLQSCALGVTWWPKLPSSLSNGLKSDWDTNHKNQSVIKVCINGKLVLFFSSPYGSKCFKCSGFQENSSSLIGKIRVSITHLTARKPKEISANMQHNRNY